MDVYNANQPALSAQTAQANDLTNQLTSGWQGAQSASRAANNKANGGVGYTSDVLAGKYLTGNPYLDQIIATNRGDITDQVNSQFTQAGRYGSGAQTDVLANSLADMENQLRFQNYTTERGYMNDAAALRSGEQQAAADRAQQAEQAKAALLLEQQKQAAQLPYTGVQNLADALGALFNGGSGTSTSTSKTTGGLGDLLGGAGGLAAGAAKLSDPTAKHSAELLWREPDGLGWYEYSYLGSDERDVGVMADEVARLRPWALGPAVNDLLTVNYDMLEAA
jgi:hypothetical protein